MLVDCHTHIDQFTDEEICQVLDRAKLAEVGAIVVAGTTIQSSHRAVTLSKEFPQIFAGVGIHPMDLQGPIGVTEYKELDGLARFNEKVLVVSEIGLDFKEGTPDRAIQYQAFREQIRLARDLHLPIVFHSREAHDETLRILKEEMAYDVGGIMHYFQADLRVAFRAIDLGFSISLARPLFRLPKLQVVVSKLPIEKLVIETDSAPQPFKSKRQNWTEPRHTREIAELISKIKSIPFEEVVDATTRNFFKVIGYKKCLVEKYARCI